MVSWGFSLVVDAYYQCILAFVLVYVLGSFGCLIIVQGVWGDGED